MGCTIGRIDANGVMSVVWSTTNRTNRSSENMLQIAIQQKKIDAPGTYLICWLNANGLPAGRVYTVSLDTNDDFIVTGGYQQSVRVNRWPPKA